jgi:hypothetical protein
MTSDLLKCKTVFQLFCVLSFVIEYDKLIIKESNISPIIGVITIGAAK